MASDLLFLIGQPGAGKSTLANTLLARSRPEEEKVGAAFVTHWHREGAMNDAVVELGRPDNGTGFRGSDRLTMNAVTFLKPWLLERHPSLLFVEGDRLATDPFLAWANEWGWRLWLFYLELSDEEANMRRLSRFAQKGAEWQFKTRTTTGLPDETWMRGRVTKAANMARRWSALRLDATRTPEQLVEDILESGCPVAATLLADC